jgi:hypothetical protein
MAAEKKEDVVRERLMRKAAVVQRALTTPEGAELFELMRAEFFVRFDDAKDDRSLAIKAGQADVIAWLMQMKNLKFNPEGR